jgi:hypothetical protein
MSLLSVVLMVVLTIFPALFRQIAPVGAVLAVVPVVVITMVPIVDSDLYAGVLGLGRGYNQGWSNND